MFFSAVAGRATWQRTRRSSAPNLGRVTAARRREGHGNAPSRPRPADLLTFDIYIARAAEFRSRPIVEPRLDLDFALLQRNRKAGMLLLSPDGLAHLDGAQLQSCADDRQRFAFRQAPVNSFKRRSAGAERKIRLARPSAELKDVVAVAGDFQVPVGVSRQCRANLKLLV